MAVNESQNQNQSISTTSEAKKLAHFVDSQMNRDLT